MPRVEILGIPVDALTPREALREIGSFFKREGQFHVATPNPEMLVEAQRNEAFRNVLRKTQLNLPDGIGLVWALRRRQSSLSSVAQRITGVDMMEALCASEARLCPPERVFLLGASKGVAERAATALKQRNPRLQIVGTHAGSPAGGEEEERIVQRINEACPMLLFVAYGAPAQDLWIARNLPKLRTVKVAMGVGGAFDFIARKRKRAPLFLQRMGLEWLWRLLCEPWRARRIWNAVFVFPWRVLRGERKNNS